MCFKDRTGYSYDSFIMASMGAHRVIMKNHVRLATAFED